MIKRLSLTCASLICAVMLFPQFVNALDSPATTLAIGGAKMPAYPDGQNLFGKDYKVVDTAFSARDSCDYTIDRIRTVRTETFRYLRNCFPDWPCCKCNIGTSAPRLLTCPPTDPPAIAAAVCEHGTIGWGSHDHCCGFRGALLRSAGISVIDPRTRSAAAQSAFSVNVNVLGITQQRSPAAVAAARPRGESSITKALAGGQPLRLRANRYDSGSGFDCA